MTQILGVSTVTVEQCEKFLHNINPSAPYLANFYKKYCDIYGIRLECVWAQMCLETNYLRYSDTSITTLDMHNYAGLGAIDGNGRRQALTFPSEEQGVRCHAQHLYAYCSANPIPSNETLIDPRFHYVTRGIAPNIENLGNGNWASDKNYASKILNIMNQMNNTNINRGDGKMSKIISYDFGHMRGSQDGGAVGYLDEYTVVRQYGQACVDELANHGYTLINCTPEDGSCETVMDSLGYRATKSNNSGAYLHLCFHANCFDSESAHGAEVEYSSTTGAEFAESVLNEICNLGFASRGIKNPSLYMTGSHVNAVAILIEPFFVSNRNDCNNFNALALGKAIARGVINKLEGCDSSDNTVSTGSINRLLMLTDPLMYGQDIIDLQTKLKQLGYGIGVDGYYGNETYQAVVKFQQNQGLGVDGIVGANTLAKVSSVIENPKAPTPSIQPPVIDHTIPSNPFITWGASNGVGYIETVPEKGRINIHLDKYNYLVIQDDPVEGNRVWIQTRTKGVINLA